MFFFFTDTAPTELYTLSLHDALPISSYPRLIRVAMLYNDRVGYGPTVRDALDELFGAGAGATATGDRKSTRLNSSHGYISYAVFCLKKKKSYNRTTAMSLCVEHSC